MYLSSGFRTFIRIRGTYHAASFAYYGLFSLFPLLALGISLGSFFIERDALYNTLSTVVEGFLPIGNDLEKGIAQSVESLITYRDRMGFIAILLLIWGSSKVINTLLTSINLAWGVQKSIWWIRSLKNLLLITIMTLLFFVSLAFPAIVQSLRRISTFIDLPRYDYSSALNIFWDITPFIVLFLGITTLFYMAPQKRFIKIKHVWKEALGVTLLLKFIQDFFTYFLTHFSSINAFYGTVGEVIGLLLWIHITGILIIFGACLSSCNYYHTPAKNYL